MPPLACPERQRHLDIRIARLHRDSLERFLHRSVVSWETSPWGRKERRETFRGHEKGHPNLFRLAETPKTTKYQAHRFPSSADCGIAGLRRHGLTRVTLRVTLPNVIRSIRNKGLKRLHEDDDPRGVPGEHVEKLRDILARLDAAGFRLHPLKVELKGLWAVTVRSNWRVIFRIVYRDVLDVDYVDYHWRRLNHADEESSAPWRFCAAPVH